MNRHGKFAAAAAALALALMAAPSMAQVPADVGEVDFGSKGVKAGGFRHLASGKWAEVGAGGEIRFQFDEVSRDAAKIVLHDNARNISIILDLAGKAVSYSAAGGAPQHLADIVGVVASAQAQPQAAQPQQAQPQAVQPQQAQPQQAQPQPAQPQAPASTSAAIDQYLRAMKYDPRVILAHTADGATSTLSITDPKERKATGAAVIITEAKLRDAGDPSQSEFALVNPSAGVLYPGALVLANRSLADGTPTLISLPRAPVTINISLPHLKKAQKIVQNPASQSAALNAVSALLSDYFATDQKTQAASSFLKVTRVFSSQQASAELGFAYESASVNAKGLLKASGSSDSLVHMAVFKQIYYTVNMEPPASPSGFFPHDLKLADLQAVTTQAAPPAYIASIAYGRMLLVRIETSNVSGQGDVSGDVEKTLQNGKIAGNASASFKAAMENASFTALLLGGSADAAKNFSGSDGLANLEKYINEGLNFSQNTPALPIAYTVAFVKDNSFATLNLSTKYIEKISTLRPNSGLKINFTGGYVGRFVIDWSDGAGQHRWESGSRTAPWSENVSIPGDAEGVHLVGEGYSGLLWDHGPVYNEKSWRQSVDYSLPGGAANQCVTVGGTSLNQTAKAGGSDGACP